MIALLVAAVMASAAAPPVALDLSGCPDVDAAAVARIVDLEMTAGPVEADADSTQVAVVCEGSAARITVVDPVTGKSMARTIALVGTPRDARARLIALAVVELVIASWAELEAVPEPAVPVVERTASTTTRTAAHRVVRPRLRREPVATAPETSFAGVARIGHSSLGLTGGAALVWMFDRGARWGFGADLAVVRASEATLVGRVIVDGLSGGAAAYAHMPVGGFTLSAGAGVRVELVRVLGEPVDTDRAIGDSFLAPTGGPRFELCARTPPAGGPTVVVIAEAGYRLLAARGRVADAEPVAFDGAWLSVSAGVGWSW